MFGAQFIIISTYLANVGDQEENFHQQIEETKQMATNLAAHPPVNKFIIFLKWIFPKIPTDLYAR